MLKCNSISLQMNALPCLVIWSFFIQHFHKNRLQTEHITARVNTATEWSHNYTVLKTTQFYTQLHSTKNYTILHKTTQYYTQLHSTKNYTILHTTTQYYTQVHSTTTGHETIQKPNLAPQFHHTNSGDENFYIWPRPLPPTIFPKTNARIKNVWFTQSILSFRIWGSHGGEYEDCCLLGCCAV
jgi:hypothetical protein